MDVGADLIRDLTHGGADDSSGERNQMVLSKESEAEILRLHYAEKWKKTTIAKQLGIHHSTVERVLGQNGVSPERLSVRPSIADPYVDFIKKTLKDYPRINATRIFHMVVQRGYPGRVDHFRDIVSRYRTRPVSEAHLRIRTLSGEQAQTDWASFGKITIGNAERKLYAFVMVLSWSRYIFLQFYVNQGTANFQRGHIDAFEFFGNRIPRQILYDNCKVAVRERIGKAILYNPDLLSIAAHYRFEPVAVEPFQPEHKGRVERGIRYVRSSFWPARKWKDLDHLNEQAAAWCRGEAAERRWVQDGKLTVQQAFEKEQEHLLQSPGAPYVVYDRKEVVCGKTPYIQFDLNAYSVPALYVRRTLTVFATLHEVRICSGIDEIALHERSFDKGQQIEIKSHIEELVDYKRTARKHRTMDRLQIAAPSSEKFFRVAAERGHNLGRLTQSLNLLLDQYGAADLESALVECLGADRIHAAAVEHSMERRRTERGAGPAVRLHFEHNQRANELTIQPKTLSEYDCLLSKSEDLE